LAHPALVTLAQELAALGPALVPLIAEDDRFLTLEWHGGGLSHPMLSGTDFWSISTGNVEIEPYIAAFPAPACQATRKWAPFGDNTDSAEGSIPLDRRGRRGASTAWKTHVP
jgi:hypothetical protein